MEKGSLSNYYNIIEDMELSHKLSREEASKLFMSLCEGTELTDIKNEHRPIPSAKRIATEMWFRIKNREADRVIQKWKDDNEN